MCKVIRHMNSHFFHFFAEGFKQERNKAFIRLVFWCRNMKTKVTRPPTQFPIWIQWSSLLNGAHNGRIQWLNQQTVGIKTEFCKQCKRKNGAKAHAKKNNMTSSKTINNRKFNWRLITRRFGRTSVNKKT